MSDWETMKHRLAEIAKDVEPIQPGEVGVWYDNAGGYCDVIWFSGLAFFAATEHENVMALTDDDGKLHGFKIDAVESMGKDGGYTIVSLRDMVKQSVGDWRRKFGIVDNPVTRGIIRARYNRDSHSFDVVWTDGDSRYVETESSHILAAVNPDGTLCGFRVIRIDLLGKDESGMAHARLKVKMAVPAG